ncbi:MAG TPA: SDR family NAD(P)-dependent oxidoreductase [Solirubrobacteraceae bacterium]|nr:SDR family NAD(P)-dependent oxidoreductase [Solirubrobacteraceae bacterium]
MEVGPGTRALVTGASRGIGRALAAELAARGAVVGLMSRSEAELGALAAGLPGSGHVVLPVDVGDREAIRAGVERFVREAGGLELVAANAGIAHYGPFAEQDLAQVERMTQVNWLGTVYTISAALAHLLDGPRGHVVVISSGAALRTFPWAAAYGATKAAQAGFAHALRHELSGTGVSLTVVYPGEIATALHDHEKEGMPDWYRGGPGAADPAELARRIVAAVQADRRSLHYPPIVRVLGVVNGTSPRAADALLRVLRGATAAPRR